MDAHTYREWREWVYLEWDVCWHLPKLSFYKTVDIFYQIPRKQGHLLSFYSVHLQNKCKSLKKKQPLDIHFIRVSLFLSSNLLFFPLLPFRSLHPLQHHLSYSLSSSHQSVLSIQGGSLPSSAFTTSALWTRWRHSVGPCTSASWRPASPPKERASLPCSSGRPSEGLCCRCWTTTTGADLSSSTTQTEVHSYLNAELVLQDEKCPTIYWFTWVFICPHQETHGNLQFTLCYCCTLKLGWGTETHDRRELYMYTTPILTLYYLICFLLMSPSLEGDRSEREIWGKHAERAGNLVF